MLQAGFTLMEDTISKSLEKQVRQQNPRNHAHKVGNQAGGDGVAHFLDAHRAEIHGHDVESGIGRAVENAGQPPHA